MLFGLCYNFEMKQILLRISISIFISLLFPLFLAQLIFAPTYIPMEISFYFSHFPKGMPFWDIYSILFVDYPGYTTIFLSKFLLNSSLIYLCLILWPRHIIRSTQGRPAAR